MGYSDEQHSFIFSKLGDISLIKAYAGTGKSFTLKEFAKKYKENTFLYFVYNKSMRIDAQKSFKQIDNVAITTFHGIAFQSVGKKYQERLDKQETLRSSDLIRFVVKDTIDSEELNIYAHALLKTLRDFTSSAENIDQYTKKHFKRQSLGEIHDYEMLHYVLGKLERLWKEIIQIDNKIPFEHDFYLKLFQLKKLKLNYDYILVDEAQDVSHVMIDIILNQTHAKKIFVGDTYQSIYSFRGAVNSLQYLEKTHSPSVFYLSKSFRCPPKVAWLANRIIKLAGAKKEFVGVAEPAPVTKQIAYIARTNSGLFGFCVNNLDKKIFFVGGVKSYNFADIIDVKNLLSKKHEYIRNDYIASFPDFKEFLSHSKSIHDISMMGVAGIVLKYMRLNIYDLIKAIKESATTKMIEADIVVTTAHKSKGLEWSQVELLDDFPFNKEKKMEAINLAELGEELRLLYVAVTRAMNNVKLPQGILEYLEVEESSVSKYLGTASSDMPQEDGTTVSEILKEIQEEKEKEEDYSQYPPILMCMCKFCRGEAFKRGNMFYCQDCDFEVKRSKIENFYKMFKKDFNTEDEKYAFMKMMTNEGHQVKGFKKKDGKLFDPSLIFSKDEKYGWGVSFVKKTSYSKKKPSGGGSGGRRKRKSSPKPY